MKLVKYEIEVAKDNCIGCRRCEGICPTRAIVMEGTGKGAFAVVDNSRCLACFRCIDFCSDNALSARERAEPIRFGTDVDSVDPAAITALCVKADLLPDGLACCCTMTFNKEVAAAVLNGARTMEDVALATGTQSGCLMYCFVTIYKLLEARYGECPPPPHKHKWYGPVHSLFDIPESAAHRYPKFQILEEQRKVREIETDLLTSKNNKPHGHG
jgi:ferredoxin